MKLISNLKNFLNISILSFVISFFFLNLLSQIFSLDTTVKIVLCFLFFFNFFRIKKIYQINNTLRFLILFFLLILISRIIEFHIFNYIYSKISEKNISWFFTICLSFLFKFLYLEILNYYKIYKK